MWLVCSSDPRMQSLPSKKWEHGSTRRSQCRSPASHFFSTLLAAFRKAISTGAMADALLSFEEDLAEGRYTEIDVLWRATLRRAADVSRTYTPKLGCRSLDVLHVATALELGLRDFVTFDLPQRQVARAVGLKSLTPRT